VVTGLLLAGGGWGLWQSVRGPSQPSTVVLMESVGQYRIRVLGSAPRLHVGRNAIRVEVTEAVTGKRVDVGTVWLDLSMEMPGMPMQAAAQLEKTDQPGVFTGFINPSGAGEWHGQLGYQGPRGQAHVSFTINIEQTRS
jgi:hypothetical protein